MSDPSHLLSELDVLPPALPPVPELAVLMAEATPTDDEARVALRAIGATTSIESVRALQLVGIWAAKLKVPQMVMTRTMTSLDEVDRVKKMAATLMEAASGSTNLSDIRDPELAVSAMKSMTGALLAEERISRLMLDAHAKSQPEMKPVTGKNKLKAVNHLHLHQTVAHQPA